MGKVYKIWGVLIILVLSSIRYVNADSCDANDIERLKVLASNIDITYEYNDKVFDESGNKIDNAFDVTFDNISNEFYIYDASTGYLYDDLEINDNKFIALACKGKNHSFEIYSSNCDQKLKVFSVKTYKTNVYSTDPLCKNHEELNVCKEDYDTSNISREEFEKIINESDSSNDSSTTKTSESTKNNILKLLLDNYIYIIGGIVVVIVIIIIISILRHKKRSVLE